jgi:hypothetical protein
MGSKWPVQKEDIRTRKRNHEDWECCFLLPVVVIHHGAHGSQDQSLKKPSMDKGEFAWDLLNSHQLVPRFVD